MIIGKKTLIRALTTDDIPKLVAWRNDPSIQSMLIGWHFPVCAEEELVWLERIRNDKNSRRFAIEADTGAYIGNIGLYDINWIDRMSGFGIFIGDPRFRGGGYATDASFALLRFAFHELGLNRLWLTVLTGNDPARKLYEKLGFSPEGVLKKHNFRGGAFHDELVMGLLSKDFKHDDSSDN